MITLLKRHEIRVLLNAGDTQAEVACLAKFSERGVRRIAAEAAVAHVDDRQVRVERRVGRPRESGPVPSAGRAAPQGDRRGSLATEVGRDPAPGAAGRLRRRQDGALRAGRGTASAPDAGDDALRRAAGRVLAARLRPGAPAVPGRYACGGGVLRIAAEVVAVGGGRSGGRRGLRDAGAHAGRALRAVRRGAAVRGVRSAQDGGASGTTAARSRSGIPCSPTRPLWSSNSTSGCTRRTTSGPTAPPARFPSQRRQQELERLRRRAFIDYPRS